MRAETVGLIVVSTELKLLTRQKTLPTSISDKEVVEIVRRMLRQLLEEMPELMIRRVGVRFSGLRTHTGQESLTSFL
ncbi:DNA polymerase IV [archaeon HR01]|nr:DNA polymerase IV [archaeon HR01]